MLKRILFLSVVTLSFFACGKKNSDPVVATTTTSSGVVIPIVPNPPQPIPPADFTSTCAQQFNGTIVSGAGSTQICKFNLHYSNSFRYYGILTGAFTYFLRDAYYSRPILAVINDTIQISANGFDTMGVNGQQYTFSSSAFVAQDSGPISLTKNSVSFFTSLSISSLDITRCIDSNYPATQPLVCPN